MLVSGKTGSGKTVWMKQLLDSSLVKPDRIIWCYGQWQSLYEEMHKTIKPKIEFVKGIPVDLQEDRFLDVRMKNLVIFDDLMSEAAKDNRIVDLFTKGSHHRNLSVIVLVQNIFHQSNGMRTISLNSHYLVLFKNPRDKGQVNILARQIFPDKVDHFMQTYDQAMSKPYGYVVIDLHPQTPDHQRLYTDIFVLAKPLKIPDVTSEDVDTKCKFKVKSPDQNPTIIKWLHDGKGEEPSEWKEKSTNTGPVIW